jgi:uncharacterized membrane-anchored protein
MTPTVKVGSGAIAGAIVVILIWLVETFTSVDIPPEIAAALTTIITFATSYLIREPDAPGAL